MKIFLSSIENCSAAGGLDFCKEAVKATGGMLYNLMSYYYLQSEKQYEIAEYVRDNSKLIMIDSGAHSFQKGTKAGAWEEFTKKYANFVRKFDRENVVGYFEMDIDNIVGYEEVLRLRKILENVSGKIIPVWHKNRGVDDFKKMCKKYAGKVIAITGFRNEDIRDEQYLMFLKYAKKYKCKVHCLGMTRKQVLDTVPFDYVDSSSWKQQSIFLRLHGRKVDKEYIAKEGYKEIMLQNYLDGVKMQKKYNLYWSEK